MVALGPSIALIFVALAFFAWTNRETTIVRALALSACAFFAWRYMAWRLLHTIPNADHPLDFVFGVVFASVECASLIGATLTNLFLSRIRLRASEADRNQLWLNSLDRPPKIDVLICTYNEDRDVLEPTILGALAMDYCDFRVWVCDDGKRSWLEQFCNANRVGYLTRDDNSHAKAGNINSALHQLSRQKQPPDFVAILDADFVPMHDFLKRTASLMREDDVAVVQTPQHFVNPDPVQNNLGVARVWPDEQRFFFDTMMACRDAWGVAFCCGTSSLIRFSVLMQIGGFPTDSVTEDYLLSLRLQECGFRTIYLNEVLSLGLAPESLKEYYGQRSRWCLGAVQIFRGPSSPLNFRNKLPFIQRVGLLDSILFWAANHTMRLLAIIVPAAFLLFRIQPIVATPADAVSYVSPYIVTQVVVFLWLTEGRVMPIMSDLYATLCATEVMKAAAAGFLRPKGQKFKVTAKGGDRRRLLIQWPLLNVFLFFLALNVAGIVKVFWIDTASTVSPTTMMAWFWSLYNIIILVLACFVCIEQPQRRYRHRFPLKIMVPLEFEGRCCTRRLRDISVSGVGVTGERIAPIGKKIRVIIDGHTLDASVVRETPGGFALAFKPTLGNKAIVIRFIFARRYAMVRRAIKPGEVLLAVGARLFR